MVEAIFNRLDLIPCLQAFRALDALDVTLTRVDCTFSYRVGSDDDVVTWLEAMERACHVRFRGRGHFDQGMCSLMFGLTLQEGQKAKASRRSTFKFYNKLREMAAHPPTCDDATAALLRKTVCGTVRGEACYRALELQRYGKDRLSEWTENTARELHRAWVDRMEMAETFTLKSEQEKDLPRWLQATYRLWRSGEDVRGLLSRRTFYRQRKELLELVGLDIAQPRVTSADPVKVVPILRVLEAKPEPEEELEALFWRLSEAA
jgi:II/X family phage/plasmid replication protein